MVVLHYPKVEDGGQEDTLGEQNMSFGVGNICKTLHYSNGTWCQSLTQKYMGIKKSFTSRLGEIQQQKRSSEFVPFEDHVGAALCVQTPHDNEPTMHSLEKNFQSTIPRRLGGVV